MNRYKSIRIVLFLVAFLGSLPSFGQPKNDWFNWHEKQKLPIEAGLSGAIVGISNGAMLVAGGSNFTQPILAGGEKVFYDQIYVATDAETFQWKAVGKLPQAIADAAVVPFKDGLLVIGGRNEEQVSDQLLFLKWDPTQERVLLDTLSTTLPIGIYEASVTNFHDEIYIAGGKDESGKVLSNFWRLRFQDEVAGDIQELPTWPGQARSGASLIMQSNGEYDCLYLMGGKGEQYFKDAYSFQPKKNKWSPISDLPRAAYLSMGIAKGQAHVLLMSGSDGHDAEQAIMLNEKYNMVKDVLAYHTITDTWIPVGQVPVGVAGSKLIDWGGRLLIVGGELRPGVRTNEIQVASLKTLSQKSKFGWIDYSTLFIYLALLAGISYYFSTLKASQDYFLGSKTIPAWAAGISIMATQVSAIGFMSIPAKVYAVNWAYFAGVLTWFIVVPIVTRAYIPFIRKLNVVSAYQYLEVRFDKSSRMFAACVFVLFQLARMGLVLYLPALALAAVTPLSTIMCILIMGVLSTVYTVLGGIEAVIWIEVVQAILLFGGAVICLILAIVGLEGGFSDFINVGIADQKFSLGSLDWNITSSTLVVILLGNVFNRIGGLTSDQAVVQRYMTTSSLKQAQRTVWADVFASIPWAIVIYALGTALYVFYKQNPENLNPNIAIDGILPMFISQNAPIGISGLIIAAIFAASMSTLEGSIHSVATIFTTDFYAKYSQDTTQKKTIVVAKIATVILGVFATGIALVLVFLDIHSILDVFQEITGLFIGATAALFMLGIFTKSTNASGAIIGAISSGIILYFVKSYTPISFWLYSAIGFLSCFIIGYLSSFIVKGRSETQGLTYYTINDKLKETKI